MSLPLASFWLLLFGLLAPGPSPQRIALDLATLHVATLTTSRGASDSSDSPYFLISVIGTRTSTRLHFPATGHWRLAEDEIVSPTPLQVLELTPGDSARVVISVLESETTAAAPELDGEAASAAAVSRLGHPLVDSVGGSLTTALATLTGDGAHWLGSVSLLLTNEGGTVWWRRMDCVKDCAVTKGLPNATDGVAITKPVNGVFELNGEGGTFHLNLRLKPAE